MIDTTCISHNVPLQDTILTNNHAAGSIGQLGFMAKSTDTNVSDWWEKFFIGEDDVWSGYDEAQEFRPESNEGLRQTWFPDVGSGRWTDFTAEERSALMALDAIDEMPVDPEHTFKVGQWCAPRLLLYQC